MMLGWRSFWILMTTMTCVSLGGWLCVGDNDELDGLACLDGWQGLEIKVYMNPLEKGNINENFIID